MNKSFVLLLLVALIYGCSNSNTSKVDYASTKLPRPVVQHVDSSVEVESVQPKVVAHKDSIIGMYTGKFEEVKRVQELKEEYTAFDSKLVENMEEDGYFPEQEINRMFYEKLPETDKKYMYLDPLYGVYYFRAPNAITLFINRINKDTVYGISICAGNERPLRGIILANQSSDTSVALLLNEPNDQQYDGTFFARLDLNNSTLSGRFSNAEGMKSFSLKSATFQYSPKGEEWDFDQGYFGKNISLEKLTEDDVENETKPHLRILRNIIYARHGYSFKKKDVREFFESYDWYVPVSTDVRSELTTVEKENISLLKRYEQYAADYYDDFGR